jgi:hypothetical protein
MSARPNLFCKFRNWRVTAEKDPKTGAYIEHHRTKDLLTTGQFFCQPPRFFDDPHDGLQGARATGSHRDIDRFLMHNLDGVPEIMRKHKPSSITQLSQVKDAEDQKALGRLARKHSRRETRVLSLSAEPGNELMWSFYGDNHRGICLCFDSQHAFFKSARGVQYVDDPNKIAEPTDDIPVNDPLLYTKAESWAWQNEWRIVLQGEVPKAVTFPREALKAVVLGEWFQQAGFDDLIRTLVQGGYQAAIFQMERLPGSFDYQATPLGQIEAKRN